MGTPEDQKKEIERIFNKRAARYDLVTFFSLTARNLIDLISTRSINTILDIATGTGTVAIICGKKWPESSIEAVDISYEMLNRAKEKARAENLCNIRFTRMDVEKLRYPPSSFDTITCGYGIFFLPSMESAFINILKLLKKGGQFVFSTFTQDAFHPHVPILVDLFKEYGIEDDTPSRNRLETEEQIEALCNQVQYDDLRIVKKEYPESIEIEV